MGRVEEEIVCATRTNQAIFSSWTARKTWRLPQAIISYPAEIERVVLKLEKYEVPRSVLVEGCTQNEHGQDYAQKISRSVEAGPTCRITLDQHR